MHCMWVFLPNTCFFFKRYTYSYQNVWLCVNISKNLVHVFFNFEGNYFLIFVYIICNSLIWDWDYSSTQWGLSNRTHYNWSWYNCGSDRLLHVLKLGFQLCIFSRAIGSSWISSRDKKVTGYCCQITLLRKRGKSYDNLHAPYLLEKMLDGMNVYKIT